VTGVGSVSWAEMDSARRDAWDAEVESNLAWVRRLALAIVRDDAVADDVAQDVMWTALRSSEERPKTLTALRAWLTHVVRSTAVDRVRSETARRAREQAASRPEADGSSSDAVDRGARAQWVVDAVMQLAEPYRSVILLRYLDQLPMAEVARRTNASETTARKRVSVGLDLLRSRLDREFGSDAESWALALIGPRVTATRTSIGATTGIAAIIQGLFLMQLKWIAAGAVAVLLALGAWRLHAATASRVGEAGIAARSDASLGALTKPAVDESRVDAARASPMAPVDTASSPPVGPGLIVRSSVGLTLPYVEIEDALGDWRRADLDHDRAAIDPAIPFPRRVRAPGHVPQTAAKLGQELTLEPDALLTLEAHELRTRTRTIRVSDTWRMKEENLRDEIQHACCWGFLSDDRWCVAVTPDLAGDAVSDRQSFPVEILMPDHQRIDVRLKLESGLRGTWRVPVDLRAAGSPLRLRVRRPPDQPRGDVVLRLNQTSPGVKDGATLYFPWGSVLVYPHSSLWMDEQRLKALDDEYTFDFVPSDVSLLIGAKDEASSAYGRITFVHDGSDRTLDMRPGFVLRGRLLDATDKSPVTETTLIWEFHDDSESRYLWRSENFPLRADASGRFEARGPKDMWLDEKWPMDPPSVLFVQISAPGFELCERTYDTGGKSSFDCGELLLTTRAPEVVLIGEGVTPAALRGTRLRVSAMPDVMWDSYQATSNVDGSTNLFLDRTEGPLQAPEHFDARHFGASERTSLPWPAQPSRWLTAYMFFGNRDEDWLFERQTDGRYAAVPRQDFEIELKCEALPPNADHWWVGWQARGQWGDLTEIAPRVVGETSHVHGCVPIGADFCWSSGEAPAGVLGVPVGIGGSVPFEAKTMRVVLR
jgi:RNA polymerase sigma-70 factor (ECF subfamily)